MGLSNGAIVALVCLGLIGCIRPLFDQSNVVSLAKETLTPVPGNSKVIVTNENNDAELVPSTDENKRILTVLVTGAAGYIGSHMALLLLEMGHRVVGVDNMSRGSERAIDVLSGFASFSFEYADLLDASAVEAVFAKHDVKFDAVMHFADMAFVMESKKLPEVYRTAPVDKLKNIIGSMKNYQVPALMYSSTCAVYGDASEQQEGGAISSESSPTNPTSPYGEGKLKAEEYIRSQVTSTFKAHSLRYFNVVGADSKGRLGENPKGDDSQRGYQRLWTSCVDAALRRKQCVGLRDTDLQTSADGSATRQYIHVEDIARAHLQVLANGGNGKFNVWNIAGENYHSNLEFIEAARRASGLYFPICFYGSSNESNTQEQSAEAEPAVLRASTTKLSSIGWAPRYKSLDDMLSSAWSWIEKTSHDEIIAASDTSKPFDVCVIGAGLSGSVLAERHASQNRSVLVLEKRNHIGGNVYDYIDRETGIRVSKYGVHLFHTQSKRVWDHMQKFSHWTPWEHRVLAVVDGKHVPVPVNIDSVNALFNLTISTEEEMAQWLESVQVKPDGEPANSEEIALARVGQQLYDLLFKPYTIKQWERSPLELAPSVLARIPVRDNHDDRYFTDKFQALPTDGYTRVFENMLNSPHITVRLNRDYFHLKDYLNCGHTYYTGPIDGYFRAQGLPTLEYRSLMFERKVFKDTAFFQPRSQVNHPSLDKKYTRIIEYKHLLNQKSKDTVVFFEYSYDNGEPYYPVPNQKNQDLYAKYQDLTKAEEGVSFVGRLANYKYFNMDQAVLNALEVYDSDANEVAKKGNKQLSVEENKAIKNGDGNKCKPGNFSSVDDWKDRFPQGYGLTEKALIAIPVGKKSAKVIDKMVKQISTANYDFTFFMYDSHDWSSMEWFDDIDWIKQPENSATGWGLAKTFLTSEKVAPYSHICFWDDDLSVTEEFDGDVFLQWMQRLDLGIVQPMIRKNPVRSIDLLLFTSVLPAKISFFVVSSFLISTRTSKG